MPQDPVVWIVLFVAVTIVVLFALWRGDVVEVTTKPLGLKFKRKASGKVGDGGKAGVSVGEGMTITGSEVGGDIVGVKTSGPGGSASGSETPVRVLGKAKVEDTKVKGDIAGRKDSDRDS